MGRNLALVLVCASLAACQSASAATNEVNVAIEGEGNHVASCQLIVLVNAVLYLGVEDGLGLASLPRSDALPALLGPSDANATLASCESVVRTVRVHGSLAPTRVTGGEPVDAAPSVAPVGQASANSIAICQRIVLLGATILGGAPHGLDARSANGALVVEGGSAPSACRVGVEALVTLDE